MTLSHFASPPAAHTFLATFRRFIDVVARLAAAYSIHELLNALLMRDRRAT